MGSSLVKATRMETGNQGSGCFYTVKGGNHEKTTTKPQRVWKENEREGQEEQQHYVISLETTEKRRDGATEQPALTQHNQPQIHRFSTASENKWT